ncbi:MAG: protein kinase, partial [Planctomycetota bacterium]
MVKSSPHDETYTLDDLQKIDDVCSQFEVQWSRDVCIADFVRDVTGPLRTEMLRELLLLDLELASGEEDPDPALRLRDLDSPADQELIAQTLHPQRIGPYVVLRTIGTGGMGRVLLAQQQHPIQRLVALKVIRDTTADPQLRQRFKQEHDSLARMQHRNVARILDAGVTEDDEPYLAMEYVDGPTMDQYCKADAPSLRDRLSLFIQVCRGVQHAHQKGIVHRDLKPTNVLIAWEDEQPVAKVIDFGLAKVLKRDWTDADSKWETKHGQLFGTLAYMSPEQASGSVTDVDARTDVYSLGIMLFQLLTGDTPIRTDEVNQMPLDELVHHIRNHEVPRPSTRVSTARHTSGSASRFDSQASVLRQDLDWVVMHATEIDPARRFQTPAALADDVQRFLDGDALVSRPPSAGYRLGKLLRKRKGLFASVIGLFLMLVLGISATSLMWWRAIGAEQDARAESDRADRKARLAIDAERSAQQQRQLAMDAKDAAVAAGARANLLLSVAHQQSGNLVGADRSLMSIPEEHRGTIWRFQQFQSRGSDVVFQGHRQRIVALMNTLDGEYILSLDVSGVLMRWVMRTGELVSQTRFPGATTLCPSINPLHVIVGTKDGDLTRIDVASLRPIGNSISFGVPIAGISSTYDRTKLCVAFEDRTIRILDSKLNVQEHTLGKLKGEMGYPAQPPATMHPDGNLLYASMSEDTVVAHSLDDQQSAWISEGMMFSTSVPDPTGRFVYLTGWPWIASSRVLALHADTGQLVWQTDHANRYACASAISADGRRLAIGWRRGEIEIRDAADGKILRRLTG